MFGLLKFKIGNTVYWNKAEFAGESKTEYTGLLQEGLVVSYSMFSPYVAVNHENEITYVNKKILYLNLEELKQDLGLPHRNYYWCM